MIEPSFEDPKRLETKSQPVEVSEDCFSSEAFPVKMSTIPSNPKPSASKFLTCSNTSVAARGSDVFLMSPTKNG